MSPSIEIDSDVLDYLKAKAEPFVDLTPNLVLRRLLDLDATKIDLPPAPASSARESGVPEVASKPAKKRPTKKGTPLKRTRAASGTLLPEERYELPLLRALVADGGQAAYREIQDFVERELNDRLLPADFEKLSSGTIRWQSRLQFVRLRLIERGLLDKNAPRGVWRITEEGRTALIKGQAS